MSTNICALKSSFYSFFFFYINSSVLKLYLWWLRHAIILSCNCATYARWQRDPNIFQSERWRGCRNPHTKSRNPHANSPQLDLELLSLLRHNVTPAQWLWKRSILVIIKCCLLLQLFIEISDRCHTASRSYNMLFRASAFELTSPAFISAFKLKCKF